MKQTYEQIYNELQKTISALERDTVNIDELSEKLDYGFQLIKTLQNVLHENEANIEKIISARTNKTLNNIEEN